MPLELLAVGDIHLGRTPLGLPPGCPPARFGPRAAWEATVSEALRRRVDAVVLLGDVVDHDQDFFEAYTPLAQGVKRLVDGGVRTFAVVGNHDVAVLPRLQREIPELRLLGAGGAWEALELSFPGRGTVRLVGWSFPSARVHTDPSATLAPRVRDGVVTLGLAHGDLGAGASHHAPLSRARLAASGCDAWLLGHVHKPTLREAADRIGYLGSLIGLDPGEPGAHGPWSVRIDDARQLSLEHLPLAALRWERVEFELAPEQSADDVQPALLRRLKSLAADPSAGWGNAELVAVRLRVTGRHAARRALVERLERESVGPVLEHAGLKLFVESIEDRTRTLRDLRALAGQQHAAARLARRLLALEGQGDPVERKRLLDKARAQLDALGARPCFQRLDPAALDDDALAAALAREGHDLLEQLLPAEEASA